MHAIPCPGGLGRRLLAMASRRRTKMHFLAKLPALLALVFQLPAGAAGHGGAPAPPPRLPGPDSLDLPALVHIDWRRLQPWAVPAIHTSEVPLVLVYISCICLIYSNFPYRFQNILIQ